MSAASDITDCKVFTIEKNNFMWDWIKVFIALITKRRMYDWNLLLLIHVSFEFKSYISVNVNENNLQFC